MVTQLLVHMHHWKQPFHHIETKKHKQAGKIYPELNSLFFRFYPPEEAPNVSSHVLKYISLNHRIGSYPVWCLPLKGSASFLLHARFCFMIFVRLFSFPWYRAEDWFPEKANEYHLNRHNKKSWYFSTIRKGVKPLYWMIIRLKMPLSILKET